MLIQIGPVMVAGNVSSNEARADLLDFGQIVLTFECKAGSDLCDWYNMNSFELDQQNLSAAPIWWIQQTVVHFHKKRDCRWNIDLDLKVDFQSIWYKALSCECIVRELQSMTNTLIPPWIVIGNIWTAFTVFAVFLAELGEILFYSLFFTQNLPWLLAEGYWKEKRNTDSLELYNRFNRDFLSEGKLRKRAN